MMRLRAAKRGENQSRAIAVNTERSKVSQPAGYIEVGQQKSVNGSKIQISDNRQMSPVIQRLAFFPDQDAAAAATAAPPLADVVWVTPLLGVNHALYPDAASAEAAVVANLGIAGAPTLTSVSAGNPASEGSYDYWYDDAAPTVLKGRPTHTSDATNKLYRVTPNSVSAYEPIVHKHAADYPGVNSDNAWGVMANPDTPYNQNAGAYDHYLLKPAEAVKTQKLAKKLAIKSESSQQKKKMMTVYESIGKKGTVA